MIQLNKVDEGFQESKSLRKDLRFKPSVMAAIERAASVVGMDSSSFITSVSYRAAQDIEKAQYRTVLSDAGFDAFAAAVDGSAQNNQALADLFAKRGALLSDG